MGEAAFRKLPALDAQWVFDERDLSLAAKLVPGAILNVLRWPVAFCIAFLGLGASEGEAGLLFVVVSVLVIGGFWVAVLLALRGAQIRKLGRLPEEHRRVRLSLEGGVLRFEDASRRASEWPLGDVEGAVVRPEGVLFRIRTQVVFVPDRALGESGDVWREAFSRVPPWTKPIGAGFTYALWALAVLLGVYGFVK